MGEGQSDSVAGRRIASYEVLKKLGAGGMGVVYKAVDTKLGRPVALKFLPPQFGSEGTERDRFLQEARTASALDHPNIGAIYGIEETPEGQMFIVMAYYAGETLAERIRRGPLPIVQAAEVAIQVAQGLSEAHARGVVHRDIKPSNIIITSQGMVKIVDFGLAKLQSSPSLTATGTTVGTAAYMAPEQAAARGDHRSDLWSLGVVLYEMLSGRLPFKGDSYPALLMAAMQTEPAPLPPLPAELQGVVLKALAKNPAERYQSAAELVEDLRKVRPEQTAASSAATQSMVIPESAPEVLAAAIRTRGGAAKERRLKARTVALVLAPLLVAVVLLIPPVRRGLPIFSGSREKHVAVLPFNNVGNDPDSAALCDGLMETLTGKLTSLEQFRKSLWVVPASEVRRRNISSPTDAQRQFGVNLVVTGSVQRLGGGVRMVIGLVDAANLRQVGSQVLDDAGGNFANLQDGAVVQLARLLEVELSPQMLSANSTERALAPHTYEAYLKGLGYLQRYDKPGNLDSAVSDFEAAIKADAQFALAHAGLGESYWMKYRVSMDPRWIQQALDSCKRANDLNGQLAQVQVLMGRIQDATGQRDLAVAHFQHALELDPRSAEAIAGMARSYEFMGRTAEAEAAFQKAVALRPDYWDGINTLGSFYFRGARYRDAEIQFRRVLTLTPDNPAAYSNLGVVLTKLEDMAGAQAMYEKSIALSPTYAAYTNLANLYSAGDKYSLAAETYRNALALNDKDYRVWGSLGRALFLAHGWGPEVKTLYERAVTMAEAAVKAQPGDGRAWGLLASYQARLGRNEEAAANLHQSLVRGPDDIEVMAQAASVYEMLGQRAEALRWTQQAVAHGYSLAKIKRDPELRKLREDPAFKPIKK